jgi:glycosyltransferase involved in cell wall biosynthesis
MLESPRVKVLMSTYNGANFIDEQISSIFCQKGVEVDLIVRDDGSTDDTISILKKWRENHQFDFLQGTRLGPGLSFLNLIKSTNCEEYIALADQDDFWFPDRLSKATQKLSELNAFPALYCSNVQFISNDVRNLEVSNLPNPQFPLSIFQNSAMGCTIVLNKKAHEILKKSSGHKMIMHDWYIFLIILATGKVIFDTQPTIGYRIHDNQFIGWKRKRRIKTIFSRKVIREVLDQSQSIYDDYENCFTPTVIKAFERLKLVQKAGFLERIRLLLKEDFTLRDNFYMDFLVKLRLLLL